MSAAAAEPPPETEQQQPAKPHPPGPPSYHERQRRAWCAAHTINNLCQRPAVTPAQLEQLARQLHAAAPVGRHSTWWLGNYSVEVLELALQELGLELHWHDARDAEFSQLDLGACWGVICNVAGRGWLSRMTGGRHWFGLRSMDGCWWNLDSHLVQPEPLGSADDVRAFLQREAARSTGNGVQVFSLTQAVKAPAAAEGAGNGHQSAAGEQQGTQEQLWRGDEANGGGGGCEGEQG